MAQYARKVLWRLTSFLVQQYHLAIRFYLSIDQDL